MTQTPSTPRTPRRGTATTCQHLRTTKAELHIRVLRETDVIRLTGLSRTTIWRRVRDGSFPPPIRPGPSGTRAKGWRHTDLQDWIDSLGPAA